MSADNYLYVGKRGDKYAIVDRSASYDGYAAEIEDDERPVSEHDSAWDAHQEAARLDYTGLHYTEYGVSISPGVAEAMDVSTPPDTETEQAQAEEIARLREFGEHYSGAAQDAWDRIAVLEKALREIAEEQQKTLGWIRAHGIVFDGPLGTDPSNWENVAFSIYSDLCEVDSIARAALAAAVVSTEPTE